MPLPEICSSTIAVRLYTIKSETGIKHISSKYISILLQVKNKNKQQTEQKFYKTWSIHSVSILILEKTIPLSMLKF